MSQWRISLYSKVLLWIYSEVDKLFSTWISSGLIEVLICEGNEVKNIQLFELEIRKNQFERKSKSDAFN